MLHLLRLLRLPCLHLLPPRPSLRCLHLLQLLSDRLQHPRSVVDLLVASIQLLLCLCLLLFHSGYLISEGCLLLLQGVVLCIQGV